MPESNENSIQSITFREHLRKRPGMYIGSADLKGIAAFVKGVAIDVVGGMETEKQILNVHLADDGCLVLKGFSQEPVERVYRVLSSNRFHWEYKMLSYLPHLSSTLALDWSHLGLRSIVRFEDGKVEKFEEMPCEGENEFCLRLRLDSLILKVPIDFDLLADQLRQFALLNPGMEILLHDNRLKWQLQQYFHFPEGVFHLFERLTHTQNFIGSGLYINRTIGQHHYRIALGFSTDTWSRSEGKHFFCNDKELIEPGSLHRGIKKGIKNGIHQGLRKFGFNHRNLLPIRSLKQDVMVVAAIRCAEPVLEGCSGTKLNMNQVEFETASLVEREIEEHLQANKNRAFAILNWLGWEIRPIAGDGEDRLGRDLN